MEKDGGRKIFNLQIMKIIQNECDNYEKLIDMYESEIKSLPKGNLHIKSINGKKRFYNYVGNEANKKREKYISIEQKEYIKQLVTKKTIEANLSIVKENYRQNLELLKKYRPYDIVEMKANLPKHLYELSLELDIYKEIEKIGGSELSLWEEESYEKNEFFSENIIYRSSKGLGVRSKSESIIASILEANKIPFRYEAALDLGSNKYYPDFTLLNPKDNRKIYWEHFGMLDNREYLNSMTNKLAKYRENGIIEWDNLIVTSESMKNPFDTCVINRIIDLYFK